MRVSPVSVSHGLTPAPRDHASGRRGGTLPPSARGDPPARRAAGYQEHASPVGARTPVRRPPSSAILRQGRVQQPRCALGFLRHAASAAATASEASAPLASTRCRPDSTLPVHQQRMSRLASSAAADTAPLREAGHQLGAVASRSRASTPRSAGFFRASSTPRSAVAEAGHGPPREAEEGEALVRAEVIGIEPDRTVVPRRRRQLALAPGRSESAPADRSARHLGRTCSALLRHGERDASWPRRRSASASGRKPCSEGSRQQRRRERLDVVHDHFTPRSRCTRCPAAVTTPPISSA